MTLVVVRHAKAEDIHPQGDSFRKLSEKGLRRLASIVPPLRNTGIMPEIHLSSPYVRAKETGEFLVKELGWNKPIEIEDCLTPDSQVGDFHSVLLEHHRKGVASMAVYTHNPFASNLARYFLDWKTVSEDLVFHTPTALALELDPELSQRKARFLWIIHPVD